MLLAKCWWKWLHALTKEVLCRWCAYFSWSVHIHNCWVSGIVHQASVYTHLNWSWSLICIWRYYSWPTHGGGAVWCINLLKSDLVWKFLEGTNWWKLRIKIKIQSKLLYLLPTTSWRDSGYERFTLGLETNCIRKWERKQPQIITILQILKTKQTSAWESSAAIKGRVFP